MIESNVYTIDQVAEALRLSRPSIYRLMADRRLGYVQFGERGRRVLGSQLEAFLERSRREAVTA